LFRITKTAQAERDFDEIWFHIAVDNICAADELLNAIGHCCCLLARQPMMGRARPELAPDLRVIECPLVEGSKWRCRPIPDGQPLTFAACKQTFKTTDLNPRAQSSPRLSRWHSTKPTLPPA
jgi:hypothetical protein